MWLVIFSSTDQKPRLRKGCDWIRIIEQMEVGLGSDPLVQKGLT